MEVTVDASGRRVMMYRPYIDQEELKRNVVVYDPNGYNLDSGLYSANNRKCCEPWSTHLRQSRARPTGVIDKYGRLYKY